MDANQKSKLSAIVFTDIVGFTELSAKNEPAALELINKQRGLLKPIVEDCEGVWLKEIGDGLLLTFNSSVEAVNCCIEIQKVAKNTKGLNLRIAIHQGEVILQAGDIIGDDVNITSRIEKYAAAGGIAISDRVNAALERNPEFSTQYLGSPNLKGVSQEVKIYSIISHGLPSLDPIIESASVNKQKMNWNIFSITGAVLSVVGILFWINISLLSKGAASSNKIPSVVILPFENKGDSKEDFYAYGISSDIISDITGVGQLRVASLSSVEKLQKEKLDNNEIAKKLTSRYVVSGSIWKIDSIFQLSMELFDTGDEKLLASQRWEMNWKDLPILKKNLSKKIIEGLNIQIINELDINNSIDPIAYELYLKGKHTFEKRQKVEDIEIARDFFLKALELDSNFIEARYVFGNTYHDSEKDIAMKHYELALKKANEFDDKKAKMDIKRSMGHIYAEQMEVDRTLSLYRQSLKISKEIGNKSSMADVMNNIGAHFWERGISDSARYYFDSAYDIIKELGDKVKLLRNRNNMALIHWQFDNDLEKGILNFEESISYIEELEIKNITAPYVNLGIIHLNVKRDFKRSREYFDKVIKNASSVDNRNQLIFGNYWLGIYNLQLFEHEKAIEYLNKSYKLSTDLGFERLIANSLAYLIACHEYLNNKPLVKKYFDKSYEMKSIFSGDIYKWAGIQLMWQGNHQLSNTVFLEQLKIEKKNSNENGIINVLTNIGLNYFYKGDYKSALENFNLAIDQRGEKELFNVVETLTFKHLANEELGVSEDDNFLRDYINKKMEADSNWFKNEPEYINWALYEYFGEDKYIIEAKRKLDLVLDNIDPDKLKNLSSYPAYQVILDSYNSMQNL